MNEPGLLLTLGVIPAAILGALAGSAAGCIPALHIYTLIGVLLLLPDSGAAGALPGLWLSALTIGLVTGWTLVNTVPAVFLSAPDESALFTVLPGQRFLMDRRGYEAVILTVFGAAGALALVFAGAPFAPRFLPGAHQVLSPHYHWIIWTVMAFMIMSEWPQGRTAVMSPWDRFTSGMANTFAGLATFLLAGLLGFILLYRPPLPVESAFQNLTPAFAGLFALPWLILNLVSRIPIPPQQTTRSVRLGGGELLRGIAGGTLGGAFAAFVPVVSGGIGGMLAGHATSLREERTFLVAQGASKAVYYVGGLLLLFVPGLQVARGAGASMLRGLYTPTLEEYWPALAAAALAMSTTLLVLPFFARLTLRIMERTGYRAVSWCSLILIVLLVFGVTGLPGLAVLLVATGIGLIPVLFGSRRMNCLGVILLPLACNFSGIGPDIARFLGLL